MQDCDTVINYDIHWNPVRLIQRFGRIDRIGSKNKYIKMINFFPDMELNEYLNLERRVKGKMIVTNMTATGDEDVLSPEMNDFKFRKKHLEKLQNEIIDLEDVNDSISLTDLNLNDYKYDIKQYLKENPDIKKVPKGIYAVTKGINNKKGVIFCFKRLADRELVKEETSIYPYYLVYITEDGQVQYDIKKVREVLNEYRGICYEKRNVNQELIDIFNTKTKDASDMKFYSNLVTKSINIINGEIKENEMHSIFSFGGLFSSKKEENEDFELVSMLIVE